MDFGDELVGEHVQYIAMDQFNLCEIFLHFLIDALDTLGHCWTDVGERQLEIVVGVPVIPVARPKVSGAFNQLCILAHQIRFAWIRVTLGRFDVLVMDELSPQSDTFSRLGVPLLGKYLCVIVDTVCSGC